jgi:hypothetical protein
MISIGMAMKSIFLINSNSNTMFSKLVFLVYLAPNIIGLSEAKWEEKQEGGEQPEIPHDEKAHTF